MRIEMRRIIARCLVQAVALVAATVFNDPHTVDLGYAKYQGSANAKTGNIEFLGIRYAQSPTGDLRWREPKLPLALAGIQLADTLPPNCPRGAMGVQPTNPFRAGSVQTPIYTAKRQLVSSSEDCLFLNVFVPGNRKNAALGAGGLPVVVWIHGGGYIGGGIGNDGNDLISAAKGGVVVVQMQYRLGVFGFLAGKEVEKHGVLNAGLLDQQFALRWIQRHIRKFGGDPTRVTIWGQSAGAGSVLQHLVANGGKTEPALFRGAITSSTFVPSQYPFDGHIPEAIYNETINRAGCTKSKNTLDCLRQLSTDTLKAINVDVCSSGFYGTFVFAPVVDGAFIRRRPSEAISRGEVNSRYLLAVTNTYEGVGFVDPTLAMTMEVTDYISNLFPLLPQGKATVAASFYQGLGTNLERIGAIMGEGVDLQCQFANFLETWESKAQLRSSNFTCPTYFLLKGITGRAFKGHFAVPPARHAGDVAYYYPSNGLPAWTHADFDKAFSESFLNFVLALDPNVKTEQTITPPWDRWRPESGAKTEMVFNRTGDTPDIHDSETDLGLWERCS